MTDYRYLTCKSCGRVAFGVTREYVEAEVRKFNEYFFGATEEIRESFGNRPSSIESYEKCIGCGGSYKNFCDTVEGDCPRGVTINPILLDDTREDSSST